MAQLPRTWIEISASAVRHNLRTFQRLVGPNVGIMPIIKANGYGHGLQQMITILRGEKYAAMGVAYGEEALRLRSLGYRGRMVVLSFWRQDELAELLKKRIEVVAWDFSSLTALNKIAHRLHSRPKVHIKLDTGTTRIGFVPADLAKLHKTLRSQKSCRVVGLFSHFANAEEQSTTRTKDQLKRFTTLGKQLDLGQGIERHIACTAAILRYPEARFGLVRLGIGLYGLWPSAEIQAWSRANLPAVSFRPGLAWYTRLAQIKIVPAGTGIGYGSTVIARRQIRIGILPVGYADGYDRRLSNNGYVMIGKQRAKIIGRVCMNLTMVDVTAVRSADVGDTVTLIGAGVSLDGMAQSTDTINYELAARLSPTIERRIIS